MTADEYLARILAREAVDTGPQSAILRVAQELYPTLQQWGGQQLLSLKPSGSYAKGTANRKGTDIDLFISLSETTTETLQELYNMLFDWMKDKGYSPRKQNVSIGVRVNNSVDVDLVPGKRQNAFSQDHSLYKKKTGGWTKTNVDEHIAHVRRNNRLAESRIIKLWRTQNNLEFPGFYVELTVIAALQGEYGGIASNVMKTLTYLANGFSNARVVDPANTANIISDDLTLAEKTAIKSAASAAIRARTWEEIIT